MTARLTDLQRSVVERLNFLGMEDFARRATIAWRDGRRYPCALTPAEMATMEGATLCNDFKNANAQAAASAPTPIASHETSLCSRSSACADDQYR